MLPVCGMPGTCTCTTVASCDCESRSTAVMSNGPDAAGDVIVVVVVPSPPQVTRSVSPVCTSTTCTVPPGVQPVMVAVNRVDGATLGGADTCRSTGG